MLLDRLLTDYSDPSSYYAAAVLQGVEITLDLRQFGERFVFYYRRFESQYVSTLQSLYPGGNFVDVGSHIGTYVVSMAPIVRNAGGRIFSIEPIPSNLERQVINVRNNGCEDIVEYATVVLGSTTGSVSMNGEFDSSSVNAVVSAGGSHSFEMTTLDQLAETRGWSRIGAVKIDVEGYEPEVLRGGIKLLARDRPVILAEFNRERMTMNGFDIGESWRMLKELGYRGYALIGSRLHELSEPGDLENLFFLQTPVK